MKCMNVCIVCNVSHTGSSSIVGLTSIKYYIISLTDSSLQPFCANAAVYFTEVKNSALVTRTTAGESDKQSHGGDFSDWAPGGVLYKRIYILKINNVLYLVTDLH